MPDACTKELNRYAGGDRTGAYGTPGFAAGGFFKSPLCCQHGQPVDVQMTLHPYDKYDWLSNYSGYPVPGVLSMEIAFNEPKSRGRVSIASNDSFLPPVFVGPYLTDPSDADTLVWAIREARKIAATAPLVDLILEEVVPGPEYQTDEELKDFIRCGPRKFQPDRGCSRKEQPVNHLAGTSRMGTGPDAVVDSLLRVHGVDALRVVDASVMPALPSGNPHATVMMLGERAADIIAAQP